MEFRKRFGLGYIFGSYQQLNVFKARILEEVIRVGTVGGGKVSMCLGDELMWAKGMENGGGTS